MRMLTFAGKGLPLCDGLNRRECLRVGGLGLGGLSLPALLASRGQAAGGKNPGRSFGRAKSVILFWLNGGAPQHETWDPKPEGPSEIRGDFGAIGTKTPGLFVGELMPQTAQLTDRIAVLRAVVTGDNAHSSSGYQMLTGVPHIPLSQENAVAKAPNFWPSTGAIVRTLRSDRNGLPAAITLPRHIANVGEILWPGQDAGFLGRKYDPWLLTCDPSEPNFQVPALDFPEGVTADRFGKRRDLLDVVNRKLETLGRQEAVSRYDDSTQQALGLMSGSKARRAFLLTEESDKTRDRYGRMKWQQSVLLARRLIEAGTSLVQINWQRIDDKENNGSWDTHKAHAACLKEFLMPMMDQTYSALIEDLADRGLLDETLVVWMAEFGHTPKINRNAGRDHWGSVFSVALAGGGIRGGQVHGGSDESAAYPVSGRVEPRDLMATIYHCLGYESETPMYDTLGRPMPISRGAVIEELF